MKKKADVQPLRNGVEAPCWPCRALLRKEKYPQKVSELIAQFYEILHHNNPCSITFGRTLEIPLFAWAEINGVNTCYIAPYPHDDEGYKHAFPLRIYINSVWGLAAQGVTALLELERDWSNRVPKIDEEMLTPYGDMEMFDILIADSEVQAAARCLPEFLSLRLHKRAPETTEIKFLRTDDDEANSFYTVAGLHLLQQMPEPNEEFAYSFENVTH